MRSMGPFKGHLHYNFGYNVFYRESTEPLILAKANEIARQAYPDYEGNVTWTFIATWRNIPADQTGCQAQLKNNTFQVICLPLQ